jgi:16S rRNA processing protein RimM
VLVAIVLGAHGVRGEVKVRSLTEDPTAFATYEALQNRSGEAFEIARARRQKDCFIVSFRGVNDRNRAEGFKGMELFVRRERLPEVEADEVYAHDLIGLPVVLKGNGQLGEIVSVPNYGAGDLLEVKVERRKETVLIPFAQRFVTERRADRIVVDLPEGFLDGSE